MLRIVMRNFSYKVVPMRKLLRLLHIARGTPLLPPRGSPLHLIFAIVHPSPLCVYLPPLPFLALAVLTSHLSVLNNPSLIALNDTSLSLAPHVVRQPVFHNFLLYRIIFIDSGTSFQLHLPTIHTLLNHTGCWHLPPTTPKV